MHAERLGSVFRTVLLSLRTLLIWSANLAVFYAHVSDGVGERWDKRAAPIQVFGFVFLLSGTILYAQGSSSVVRHTAEVISDVQIIGQAVRQMSALSAQSLESVWTELAQRPGTPQRLRTMSGTAPSAFGQAPFDMLAPQSLSSLNGAFSRLGSPIIPGPLITAALRPNQVHISPPPQSPASVSHISGFAGQDDDLTAAGSIDGTERERPSFTDDMNSVVNSGILDVALSASFRESFATMPYTVASASVSAPSELHTAFLRRPSFESAASNAGYLSGPGQSVPHSELTQALDSQSTADPLALPSMAGKQSDTASAGVVGASETSSHVDTGTAAAAVAGPAPNMPGTPGEAASTPGQATSTPGHGGSTPGHTSAPGWEECAVGHAVSVLGQQRQYDKAVKQDVMREIKLRNPENINNPSLKGTLLATTSWVLNSPAPVDSSQHQGAGSFQNPFVPQIPRSNAEMQAAVQNRAATTEFSGDGTSISSLLAGGSAGSILASVVGRRPSNMSGFSDAAFRSGTFEGIVHQAAGHWPSVAGDGQQFGANDGMQRSFTQQLSQSSATRTAEGPSISQVMPSALLAMPTELHFKMEDQVQSVPGQQPSQQQQTELPQPVQDELQTPPPAVPEAAPAQQLSQQASWHPSLTEQGFVVKDSETAVSDAGPVQKSSWHPAFSEPKTAVPEVPVPTQQSQQASWHPALSTSDPALVGAVPEAVPVVPTQQSQQASWHPALSTPDPALPGAAESEAVPVPTQQASQQSSWHPAFREPDSAAPEAVLSPETQASEQSAWSPAVFNVSEPESDVTEPANAVPQVDTAVPESVPVPAQQASQQSSWHPAFREPDSAAPEAIPVPGPQASQQSSWHAAVSEPESDVTEPANTVPQVDPAVPVLDPAAQEPDPSSQEQHRDVPELNPDRQGASPQVPPRE